MRRHLVVDRRSSDAPGASFVQVNPEIAALLLREVVARTSALDARTAIDAYSGAGDTAATLTAQGVRVVAIESDAEATAYCGARQHAPARVVTARVEDVLASLLPADVVILNPPRTGVHERVTKALARVPGSAAAGDIRAILYVSCDPATLARDVSRLKGWRVHDLVCFDMFPQTSHVETVCELRPETA